jgi:hypothetical protein
MNPKKILSALVLSLVLSVQAGTALAQSDQAPATPDTPKVMKDCAKLVPKYPDSETIDASKIDLSKPYKDNFDLNFRIAFEKASNQYHLYMECVFEGMVKEMLGSAGGDTSGIFAAHAPDLPEWMKPESACQKEETLATLLKESSPEQLVKPLLDKYNTYVDYLLLILKIGRDKVNPVENGQSVSIAEIAARKLVLRNLVENEIQDSLAALDGAFNGVKEMRKAFIMHVHFQCMLRNLELYRHAMENLRRVVSGLPSVIENASMH